MAESTIRAWVREFEMMEYVITDSKRGKHSKTASPILNDPDFREEFKNYVKTSSCEKGNRYLKVMINKSSSNIKVKRTSRVMN